MPSVSFNRDKAGSTCSLMKLEWKEVRALSLFSILIGQKCRSVCTSAGSAQFLFLLISTRIVFTSFVQNLLRVSTRGIAGWNDGLAHGESKEKKKGVQMWYGTPVHSLSARIYRRSASMVRRISCDHGVMKRKWGTTLMGECQGVHFFPGSSLAS